jgi:protein-S-isoprenylcysteine O-methyltransferase
VSRSYNRRVIRPEYLGLVYAFSEIALAIRKRGSRAQAQSHDAGTLRLVWTSIVVGVTAAIAVAKRVELGRFESGPALHAITLALFIGGVALRWWAIVVLGRFFTVDVAIHADHELVTRGPYRVLRHPSYTGALMAFVGLGLTFGSWLGLAVLVAPVAIALGVRIRVEERALEQRFGDAWRAHRANTWRLIPLIW